MAGPATAAQAYDLLTLGETLLRLSPPGLQRLDQARLFEIGVGGSELNVGCLLARLGRRVAWVSRLPEGPLAVTASIRAMCAGSPEHGSG